MNKPKLWHCKKCGWHWASQKSKYKDADEKPRVCPKCKSPNWDRDKL